MNMNGDIQAARKLLSDLREGYQSLPRHLQLRVAYILRESPCDNDAPSRTIRTDALRAGSAVAGL
jgi:hypothetical protein